MRIVDIDDVSSWPVELRDLVQISAAELAGSTEYVPDLRPDEAASRRVHQLLVGSFVKAYHATRLLDHEVTAIREQGLRLLNEELVAGRIMRAYEGGVISDEQRSHLMKNHVFARKFQASIRKGRVCLILSRHTLDEEANGLWRLLAQWGGEGIYWTQGEEFERQLQDFGRPTIVVAGLDLSDPDSGHLIFPGLLHAFVGTVLNLEKRGAEVHYREPVPPEAILDVWQPGSIDYDQHESLWRR